MKRKNKIFLGLMNKFKGQKIKVNEIKIIEESARSLNFELFNKHYTPLLSIIYVYMFTSLWYIKQFNQLTPRIYNKIYYYAELSRVNLKTRNIYLPRIFFYTLTVLNFVIFSKPKKQLFLTFFKEKPLFIFTGGLMRLIINEKKKSSKKLYKVAINIIKLTKILLIKETYFDSCALRLVNIGRIRIKILKEFTQQLTFRKIFYVFIIFKHDTKAQKFHTRRAIKKYVKKRFKIP